MKLSRYLGANPYRVDVMEDEAHEADSPYVQLKGDNQAALALVKDARIHNKSKHIGNAYHHVRDLHKNHLVNSGFVPSKEMIADGLTKPLTKLDFARFVEQLRLTTSGS